VVVSIGKNPTNSGIRLFCQPFGLFNGRLIRNTFTLLDHMKRGHPFWLIWFELSCRSGGVFLMGDWEQNVGQ
jgi:hypothetical protein